MRTTLTLALLVLPTLAVAQVDPADVTRVLTPRHAGAPCAELMALGSEAEVTQALVTVADTVTMPPWVGTRAAHCVSLRIDEDPVALHASERWMTSPDTAGFALIVLGQLDAVKPVVRADLVTLATERIATDATFASHVRPLLRRHDAAE